MNLNEFCGFTRSMYTSIPKSGKSNPKFKGLHSSKALGGHLLPKKKVCWNT